MDAHRAGMHPSYYLEQMKEIATSRQQEARTSVVEKTFTTDIDKAKDKNNSKNLIKKTKRELFPLRAVVK